MANKMANGTANKSPNVFKQAKVLAGYAKSPMAAPAQTATIPSVAPHAEPVLVSPADSKSPKRDRRAYMRELMRRKRAKAKEASS